MTERRGQVIIMSVSNGYTISVLQTGGVVKMEDYVARSWAEVLELLEEIKAPDFIEVEKGTK